MYFYGVVWIPAARCNFLVGDEMIEITQLSQINNAKPKVKHYDATILLGYVALSIVLLIEICFASMSPGTAPGDFASMTVFP
jgi:hypothetical protein